jgi:hypothetical protein
MSWGGQPTLDNDFGASASIRLFVITCALVAKICAGGGKEMAKYQKRYCCFPLKIPWGPRTGLVSKYKELCLDVTPPPLQGSAPPTKRY